MRGIFQSSPVLTSGRVKKQYRCAWLVYPQGAKLLLSVHQAENEVFFNLCTIIAFPVGYKIHN